MSACICFLHVRCGALLEPLTATVVGNGIEPAAARLRCYGFWLWCGLRLEAAADILQQWQRVDRLHSHHTLCGRDAGKKAEAAGAVGNLDTVGDESLAGSAGSSTPDL